MAIFTRTLTRVDIERRLTIPRYCVGAFPAVQESQAVELKVNDEMGHVWTFRCSLQSAINPRLVFSSGWLHFASSKHLHVGDTIVIHREVDQDNTDAPYKIEVPTRALPAQQRARSHQVAVHGYYASDLTRALPRPRWSTPTHQPRNRELEVIEL
ncbi:hypothetical protein EZV62_019037 [Acer yangbiense]|uniref:TF-B3 domain-containing protein n=1 Tax=Acer yangbiense TaxID=1000413 RepID=A0A5C7HA52_9ROSI|nr:hypothetical protein EZV62_019037 [Acer yangbiense]